MLFSALLCNQASYAALTATQVLDNVVADIVKAPSVVFGVHISIGGEMSPASLTMAGEKFTYEATGMAVCYDGKTQWTLDSSAKEVSITTPTTEELAEINPLAFLKTYKNNYTVSLLSSEGGKYRVKMVAKKKSSYVRIAEVTVDSKTWMPETITAQLATGQSMTLKVNNVRKGNNLPVTDFRFDSKKFPKYEIIDLR